MFRHDRRLRAGTETPVSAHKPLPASYPSGASHYSALANLTILSSASKLRSPAQRKPSRGTVIADSTTSRISLTLASSLDSVDTLEHTAQECSTRAGFDEDSVSNIGMAVREAAVNAVLHGNAYDRTRPLLASFETTADDLVIRIADQGPGLDPDRLPDPLAAENILRGSGRGIFLIRAFMDEVHFRQLRPGTEITLIKHRVPSNNT